MVATLKRRTELREVSADKKYAINNTRVNV